MKDLLLLSDLFYLSLLWKKYLFGHFYGFCFLNCLLLGEIVWLVWYQRTISVVMVYGTLFDVKLMWYLMLVFAQLIEEICWIHWVILLYRLVLTITSDFFCSFFLSSDRSRLNGCAGHVLVLLWLRVKMRQKIVIGFTFFLVKLSFFIGIIYLMLFWLLFYLLLLFWEIFSVAKMLSIIKFFFLFLLPLIRNILNLLLIF